MIRDPDQLDTLLDAVRCFVRDVRAFRIYEGTSQIHLLNIAKHLLKGA